MGWTGIDMYMATPKDRQRYLDDQFNYKDNRVIKSTMRGTTYYAVINSPKYGNFAVVCLTKYSRGEFAYKDMDETMGPYAYDFPVSWLKLLSPTDNKYANEWRKKVLAKSKKASKPSVPFVTEKVKPVMVKGTKYNKTTQMRFM